ncbi:phage tail family protein [Aerococcaceae bacterium NML190073]|nr:phage tail family protein [Aerococcaceae bacterium NML190073]
MSFIKFNGMKSSDFGLRLLSGFDYVSAQSDIDTIEVVGRDGVLLKDNKRLRPVHVSYPFTITDSEGLTNKLDKISRWLNVRGWHDLEFDWDNEHIYRASYTSQLSISELFHNFGMLKLDFTLHPVKYLKTGKIPIQATQNMRLMNEGKLPAKPIIMLEGNGNMILSINRKQLLLENVQNGITIDSERRLIYNDSGAQWDKIVRSSEDDFPVIGVGDNDIEITGATSMQIIPNWAVRV